MAKRSKEDLKLLENIHATCTHTEYTEDQYIAQLLADEIRYIENMSAKDTPGTCVCHTARPSQDMFVQT